MNICNLLLASIIFCSAPIMCVASEVSLTKQEQEIVKNGVKVVKNQHFVAQELFKFTISSVKDKLLSVLLGKMSIGKNKWIFDHEVDHEKQIFERKILDEYNRFANQLIKKFHINGQQIKIINEQLLILSDVIDNLLNKIITDKDRAMCSVGEDITEANIAIAKKTIAIYSFVLMCL